MPGTTAVNQGVVSIPMINRFVYLLLFCLCTLSGMLAGCGSSDDEPYPQMPFVNVYQEVYLDDPILQATFSDPTKGFVYINAGVNGIILHKTQDSRYIALERLSPVDVEADCTVEVDDSGFFISDPCSSATWDMEGNPTGGANGWPLFQYQTSRTGLNNEYLIITN